MKILLQRKSQRCRHSILHMHKLRCNERTPLGITCRFFFNIHTTSNRAVAWVLLQHCPSVRREVRPFWGSRKFVCVRIARAHEGEPVGDELFAERRFDGSEGSEDGRTIRPASSKNKKESTCDSFASVDSKTKTSRLPSIRTPKHHPVLRRVLCDTGFILRWIRLVVAVSPDVRPCFNGSASNDFSLQCE